jgi:probable addiction module antidote protein
MTIVFVGGSRHVSRLSSETKDRLKNIIDKGFEVIVGDANGADKAVQSYMADADYKRVTVYCSGNEPRNNVGHWKVSSVVPPKTAKGFQFYAAKDRAMAEKANYGLMIWDGKSPGTILNILRLIRRNKLAVLLNVPEKKHFNFQTGTEWTQFIRRCNAEFISDLRERATPDEWLPLVDEPADPQPALQLDETETARINKAFAKQDMTAIVDLLGTFARAHGMTNVADETGLSRESLYRSLSEEGNPEFATILKVLGSLGLQLSVSRSNSAKTMQAP